jgi:hypothetical protein
MPLWAVQRPQLVPGMLGEGSVQAIDPPTCATARSSSNATTSSSSSSSATTTIITTTSSKGAASAVSGSSTPEQPVGAGTAIKTKAHISSPMLVTSLPQTVFLHTVTLMLPVPDFIAMGVLALEQLRAQVLMQAGAPKQSISSSISAAASACLPADIAALRVQLLQGIATLQPAAVDMGSSYNGTAADNPQPSTLLASYDGWGVSGQQLLLLPDLAPGSTAAAGELAAQLRQCAQAIAAANGEGQHPMQAGQVAGVVVGSVLGAVLAGMLLAWLVVLYR